MKPVVTLDAPAAGGRWPWIAGACLVAAGGAWLAWQGAPAEPDASPALASPATPVAHRGPSPWGDAADPRDAPAPAPADPARLFDLGVAGDLRLDLDTKAALELIVADLGPQPSGEQLAALDAALRAGLPRDAASQAFALVQGYRGYARELAEMNASQRPPEDADAMRRLVAQEAALRRRHFDPAAAQALFGTQEAYSRYAVEAQALDADTAIGAVEKARRLHALRLALPAEVAELEPGVSTQASELNLKVAELRERGASAEDVQAVRTQYLGAEAAASLGEMEAHHAQWAARYQAFRQQRDALLATAPADPAEAEARLLAQHFQPDELPGARAYDRQQRR